MALAGTGTTQSFSGEGCDDGGMRSRFVIPNPTGPHKLNGVGLFLARLFGGKKLVGGVVDGVEVEGAGPWRSFAREI